MKSTFTLILATLLISQAISFSVFKHNKIQKYFSNLKKQCGNIDPQTDTFKPIENVPIPVLPPTPPVPPMEYGSVDIDHEWTTVEMKTEFQNPVVLVGPATFVGTQPITLRVKDVTSKSFSVHIDEYLYLDVIHAVETISWVVVEAGTWTLPGGYTMIAANSALTNSMQQFDFDMELDAPIVFGQIVSENMELNPAVIRMHDISSTSFTAQFQVEEARTAPDVAETMSWVAIQEADCQNQNDWCVGSVADITHDSKLMPFSNGKDTAPSAFIAQLQTSNGMDCADLRVTSMSAEGYQVFIEEEASNDTETDHTTETVGFMALW